MHKKQQTTLVTLIIILLSAGAIYYFAKPQLSKNSPTTTGTNPETQSVNTVDSAISEDLVYAIRTDTYTDIYVTNSKNSTPKKVYTDRDENQKIKAITSLTYDNRILVEMAPKDEEFINSVYLIHTDGSGAKDKITDNFASTGAPMISPDGQKIAYTLFSNAEVDFGFKLIVANSDNSNKRELLKDNAGISLYSWDPSSQYLSFSKGNTTNQTEISSVNIDTLNQDSIFKTDGIVEHLKWAKDSKFIFSSLPASKDYNQSEIYSYINKKQNRITTNNTYDDYGAISLKSQISYISYDYDKTIPIIYQLGKVNLAAVDNTKNSQLSDASIIIGWLQ